MGETIDDKSLKVQTKEINKNKKTVHLYGKRDQI